MSKLYVMGYTVSLVEFLRVVFFNFIWYFLLLEHRRRSGEEIRDEDALALYKTTCDLVEAIVQDTSHAACINIIILNIKLITEL